MRPAASNAVWIEAKAAGRRPYPGGCFRCRHVIIVVILISIVIISVTVFIIIVIITIVIVVIVIVWNAPL